MRMLLVALVSIYLVASREPPCYEGDVYRANKQPWSQVDSPTKPSKCYFHIEFKMDSLASCSFNQIVVQLGHERKDSRTNQYGNCSFVTPFWFISNPYLRCQCEGSHCNSRLEKILPILDDFRRSMDNGSETMTERNLLNCIESELETLALLPKREETRQEEPSTVVPFFIRHDFYWITGICLLLLLIVLVLLLIIILLVKRRKPEKRRPKKCHYECWNVIDPTDRGTFFPSGSIPSMSRETIKPEEEEH